MTVPFTLVAPLAGADGYGQSAEGLALAARALGAEIAYVPHDWQDDRFTSDALRDMLGDQRQLALRELAVVFFLPFAFARFRSRVTLGMTMFETDSIPPFWVGLCNSTQGLIVPSEHCRRAFEKHVDVPVRVAPLGVDTKLYRIGETPLKGYGDFWFLMAGLLHYRKGAEFAVRAFLEEFESGEPARLILKTRRGFLDVGEQSLDDPRIVVADGDYTREEMRTLYQDADCFVACSRGEASGLTPREAMACGTPVIITNWGGLEELADDRYCYVTGIDDIVPAPLECSSYGAGVAGHLPIGNFCVPSVTEIRAAMRRAYEDREANREMGERAAAWVAVMYPWERCAAIWLHVIDGLWQAAQ